MSYEEFTSEDLLYFLEGTIEKTELSEADDSLLNMDFQQEMEEIKKLPPLPPLSASALLTIYSNLCQKRLKLLITTVQEKVTHLLEEIEPILQEAFAYPWKRFAFQGKVPPLLYSPFGKVRYPIIFEWRPFEGAEEYRIRIEETDWAITTKETVVEISSPQELELTPGEEYTWTWEVIKSGEIVEEETRYCSFEIPTLEEIEELRNLEEDVKIISPEAERLIVWGSILENKEMYIEAIKNYKKAYYLEESGGLAYRIASCYHKLQLEGPRDEWNEKIPKED